jgi:hypothetical protein
MCFHVYIIYSYLPSKHYYVCHAIVTRIALRDVSTKQFPGKDSLEIAVNEKLH